MTKSHPLTPVRSSLRGVDPATIPTVKISSACSRVLAGWKRIGLALALISGFFWPALAGAEGTWIKVQQKVPGGIGNMLLLSDGTVMAQGGANQATNTWYRLTPDSTGGYTNGTWTTRTSMNFTRLFYSSAVLPDGRVFFAGAEYGAGTTNAEVYNPFYSPNPDSWTIIPVPSGLITVNNVVSTNNNENSAGFMDSGCVVLTNGNVLIAPVNPASYGQTVLFNPSSDTLSLGPQINSGYYLDEASMVKLPDDSILVVDSFTNTSERYIPSLNQWITDANVPVNLYDPYGKEMGAGFLLPNGNAFFLGSTPNTAIYTPSGTTAAGIWTTGPTIPNSLGAPDAPAAMMPNGKILCAFAQTPYGTNSSQIFIPPIYFYEFDYNNHSATPNGTFVQVHAPDGTLYDTTALYGGYTYTCRMLDLPDGTVLFTDSNTNGQLYVYIPDASPLAAGKAVIQNYSWNLDGSIHLIGTLFNGISQGAAYGDDAQMDSNYPLIRFTDASGNVTYGTTYNWSSTGVRTGSKVVTTEAAVPTFIANGSQHYSMQVVANGIASDPVDFYPLDYPTVNFISPTNGAVGSDAYAPLILGSADDNNSAISTVRVALNRISDGAWYDFVSGGWGTTTFDFNRNVLNASDVSGQHTGWIAQLPAMAAGNYTVQAESVNVHNHASPWKSVAFTIESAPVVTFSPLTNRETVFDFSQLGGTINEAGTVAFRIEQYDTSSINYLYWNGSSWIANGDDPSVYLPATVTGGNWLPAGSVALPTRRQLQYGHNGHYFLRAIGTNLAGDTSTNEILVNRSAPDTTPPVVTLDTILNGAVFTNRFLPGLSGSALDYESGITSIRVNLYRFSGGTALYWDGSSWSPSLATLSVSYNPQTVAWQVTSPLPSGDNLPNGGYGVEVYGLNGESPALNKDLIVNFAVDYHPVYVFNFGSQFGPTPNMNWDSPDNWDVGKVPYPDVRVVINGYSPVIPGALGVVPVYGLDMSGGTLSMSGMLIQKLNLSGGQIYGGALILTNNGTSAWSGGNLNVATLTVLGGSTLILTNNVNHDLPNCTITNYGSVVWSGGYIRGGGTPAGTLVYNYGLWDVQCDQAWDNSTYQNLGTVFNNYGTLRKSVGTNSSQTVFPGGVYLNQLGGVLDVQQGTFSLQGGASFAGGYVTTNTTGTVLLAAGNFNLNGAVTSSNVVENGGNLVGTDVIRGALTWLGGIWNGATVTVTTNSTVYLASSANMDMANTTVTNNGAVLWSGGYIRGGGTPAGTLVYNYGLWDVQCDQAWDNSTYQNLGTVFNNYGTFRKSVGANGGQTVFPGGVFLNQLGGVLDVQQGTFSLQGGASFAGGYVTTNTTGTVLLAGGGYNLNGAVTSTNVVENGGNLVGTNFIQGALTWLGGVWNGAHVTVTTNSTVYLASSANMDMRDTILTNNGTVLWSSGPIHGGGNSPGTFIYNNALWDVQCDQAWNFNDLQGNGTVFNNYGTFRKSVGTNSSQTLFNGGVYFNQFSGVLDVQLGNFTLQGGANFAGGYVTTNNTGTTILSGGGFTMSGGLTSSNVVENGGVPVGNNVIRGALTWLSGNWNSATMTVASNSTFYMAGAGNLDVRDATLTNNGTVLWSSGYFQGGGGSPGTLVYNNGLWDVQCDQVWNFNAYQGHGTVFNNNGTLRKSAGTNSSQTLFTGGVYLNQLSGVLDVQRGNFNLQGGANFAGGYVTTNNTGTTILSGGGFTMSGGLTSSNVVDNGGVPVGNNVIRGSMTWLSGSWNATTVTVSSNSTVYLAGGGSFDLRDATLTNNGTMYWSGGPIHGGGGSPGTLVYNYGLWDVQCDQAWTFNDYQGNGTSFNNYGTFRKEGTVGTTTFTVGSNFTTPGTVDLRLGTVAFNGAVYPGPTSKLNLAIGGINAGTQFGSESFGFPPPFTGTLSITLTNGFVPTNGNSFVIATFPSSTGQFSSIQFPPLPVVSKWQLTYNPTSLLLQVVPSTAFLSSSLTNGNFKFSFAGQTGSSCLIEVSTNLLNWTPLLTNTPFNGTLNYVDPQTPQFRIRFYRATIFP